MKKWTICLLPALLGGCGAGVDLSGVEGENAKTVKRYDIVQSVASNGERIVGGTQTGAILGGTDGKSWTRTVLGPVSMIGLATCPDKGFIGIDFYHKVWFSDAQGSKWQSVPLDKPRVPLTVSCDAKGRWWVAGSGAKIAMSADRGTNWTVTDLGEDAQFTAFQMIDDQHGIALGEFGIVVTSNDGGASWKKTATIPGEFYTYATLFVNPQEGWASGLAGQILHTRDGGKTWNKDPWSRDASPVALYQLVLHDGKPYGSGAGGIVARYDGHEWQNVAYPDAAPVFLGGAASAGKDQLALGGPGGLIRLIDTHKN